MTLPSLTDRSSSKRQNFRASPVSFSIADLLVMPVATNGAAALLSSPTSTTQNVALHDERHEPAQDRRDNQPDQPRNMPVDFLQPAVDMIEPGLHELAFFFADGAFLLHGGHRQLQ